MAGDLVSRLRASSPFLDFFARALAEVEEELKALQSAVLVHLQFWGEARRRDYGANISYVGLRQYLEKRGHMCRIKVVPSGDSAYIEGSGVVH